jgi:hypothetical protein
MGLGDKIPSFKSMAVGTLVLGITGGVGSSTDSLQEKLNRVLKHSNAKVAQTPTKGSQLNKGDGNSSNSTTTYHSYAWDYCEEWVGTDLCKKWLDPYISDHGFSADKSALEGKIAEVYSGARENKSANSWGIWDVEVKAGQEIKDEQGRLNRKALSKFEIKEDVQTELKKIGKEAALDNLVDSIDKDAPKDTIPNSMALRALAANYTQAYRNNLVGLLGGVRRMKEGIEVPGGENYLDCASIMSQKQSEETDEKLSAQAPLTDKAIDTGLEKRIQLCNQMMQTSIQMVNPVAQGDQIVSGDPNSEQIDEWRIRANLQVLDDLTTDASKIQKPSDANLNQRDLASEMVVSNDGKEETVYELPKEQIETYNKMLENAAKAQAAVAKVTLQHIGDSSRQIESNKINGSISAIEINGLTPAQKKDLKDAKVNSVQEIRPEMTPGDLIQTANQ